MHDRLYEHQKALGPADLVRHAEAIGLDVTRFRQDLEEGSQAKRVQDNFLSGVRSGVNGTPTFFINGLRYDGSWDLESLLQVIETAAPR